MPISSDTALPPSVPVRVVGCTWETEGVRSIRVARVDGADLPAFEPGAHAELVLRSGLRRAYSLIARSPNRQSYEFGILKVEGGRGGSRHVHDILRVGDVIEMALPHNSFPLFEGADHSVMIAGGIGITPFLPMIARLSTLGRGWTLFYCARSPADAAFLDRLDRDDPRVQLRYDDRDGLLDISDTVRNAPKGTHFYCCGPHGMLGAFRVATAGLRSEQVHLESFAPIEVAAHGAFVVQLARTGTSITIPENQSILEGLLAAGFDPPYSCQQGMCGACEVAVLSGIPDHRDDVLSDEQKSRNDRMMLCCSLSRSPSITIDF